MVSQVKRHVGTGLTDYAGEYLEWIVIVLIAAEIMVAVINIIVDLYAGVD
jgi:uncharacterized Rmd1/YagE family protein